MKFVVSARPVYGHIYPLMPLALAARRAGHEVSFATTGDFIGTVARLGFPTHDVGGTIDAALDELLASLSLDEMARGQDGRPDVDLGGQLFIDLLAPHTPCLPARPTTPTTC